MTARVPGGLYWALGMLTMLVLGLWLVPMGNAGDPAAPPASAAQGAPAVTVVVVFPTDTPTPSPTATRTPAPTTTPWPTRPTCLTPVARQRCTNRGLPTAVPTLTPKPTEPTCEDLDLWVRKDQDCAWATATATPTPTSPAPTTLPVLPAMEDR